MNDVKNSNPRTLTGIATFLRRKLDGEKAFAAFFGSDVVIVPAPGHAPATAATQQSSTRELVQAMERQGLGRAEHWLSHETKVPKSAWAQAGERPTTQDHYDSVMGPKDPQVSWAPFRRITVVDDVITTGATLHACVRRLRIAFPYASVLAFATIRTKSGTHQIEHPIDPVDDGEIILQANGKTERVP